ncbi:hypothetical protein [Streptomyces sp. RPA4-5]|uniref:hypothetical protein n=1 Tax=Streptomyces sp. RPA4-5 TaxID=2721245 RepID=UPI002001E064|nr:hypothetical protein [Streptomyces sp. RPA4-5]
MDHGGDGCAAEQQRGRGAHDGVPAALAPGGHRAAQLLQRVRRGFEVGDAGVQQPPEIVLAAEVATGGVASAGAVAVAAAVAGAAAEAGAGGPVSAVRMAVGLVTGARGTLRGAGRTVRDSDVIAAAGYLAGFRSRPAGVVGLTAAIRRTVGALLRRTRRREPTRPIGGPRAPAVRFVRVAPRPEAGSAAHAGRFVTPVVRRAGAGRVERAGPGGGAVVHEVDRGAGGNRGVRVESVVRAAGVVRVVPAKRRATHAGASIATRSAAMPRDP